MKKTKLSNIPVFDYLCHDLDSLNWENNYPQKEIENLLSKWWKNIHQWKNELYNIEKDLFLNIANKSFEVSTHYKWLLCQTSNFDIFINEFKEDCNNKKSYATKYHNHRYDFTSLIINGGFQNQTSNFDIVEDKIVSYKMNKSDSLSKGNIYSLSNHEIHRLKNINFNTKTLVIKSKAKKEYSLAFNLNNMKTENHIPFQSRYDEFKNLLK